ncbi:uncharacterized protein LOC126982737 [Eriocheir sinensis]|uniref:uncharacterized protein LOC126982737 n=1 Tax=Eriocheir sinensis TaxID=95602 RepID=UPI0021C80198|nr:uncharacterized protein LOC126982737 [Eriocheir sinensis]
MTMRRWLVFLLAAAMHPTYANSSDHQEATLCSSLKGTCVGEGDKCSVKLEGTKDCGKGWCCLDQVGTDGTFGAKPACVEKVKCWKKGGTCKDACSSDEEVIVNGCKGKDCYCCAPAKECRAKDECIDAHGECRKKCSAGEEELHGACKGSGCKCCVEAEHAVAAEGCDIQATCQHGRGQCREWCLHGEVQADEKCGPNCVCCLPLSEEEEVKDKQS